MNWDRYFADAKSYLNKAIAIGCIAAVIVWIMSLIGMLYGSEALAEINELRAQQQQEIALVENSNALWAAVALDQDTVGADYWWFVRDITPFFDGPLAVATQTNSRFHVGSLEDLRFSASDVEQLPTLFRESYVGLIEEGGRWFYFLTDDAIIQLQEVHDSGSPEQMLLQVPEFAFIDPLDSFSVRNFTFATSFIYALMAVIPPFLLYLLWCAVLLVKERRTWRAEHASPELTLEEERVAIILAKTEPSNADIRFLEHLAQVWRVIGKEVPPAMSRLASGNEGRSIKAPNVA